MEVPASRRDRAIVALYALTLLLGAALLFVVQPLFARLVLPRLGGTPAVWTVSMMFFQAALLGGYLYAHWSTGRLGVRRQAALHLLLLVPPLIALPIALPGWDPPAGGDAALWLLGALAVAIGLPFFVVAATAPLLQRWLAGMRHTRAGDPYFLYRASNAGSIIGLLGYPLLLEPAIGLESQGVVWSVGYLVLAMLVVACAVALWRSPAAPDDAPAPALAPAPPAPAAAAAGPGEAQERDDSEREDAPPGWRTGLRWAALAFVPSSLLLGVTTYLTTDLAPIPLLWVVPLALYLFSFVIAFAPTRTATRSLTVATNLFPLFGVVLAIAIIVEVQRPFAIIAALHLITFLLAALLCHGRLAEQRPEPRRLTAFYGWIALGGALGGLFNALIAPLAFEAYVEYPLALVAAFACLPFRDRHGFLGGRRLDIAIPLVLGIVLLAGLAALGDPDRATFERLFVLGLGAGVVAMMVVRPVRAALCLGAVFLAAALAAAIAQPPLLVERSFFGTLEVIETDGGHERRLMHGTTVHGAQREGGPGPPIPITYYHPAGPVGDLSRALRPRGLMRNTGVVGLGVGSLACHARAGDRMTFFEVDEAVEEVARDASLFTFLRDCPGSHEVVLGDGRTSLAARPGERFGLLVIDAFGSDAIPVHLLTREAVALYRDRLAPGGVIAFHVTNRFADLEPVLGDVAADLGLACIQIDDPARDRRGRRRPGKQSSRWVALARRPADLAALPRGARGWTPCRPRGAEPWTDDHADLIAVVDW